MIDITGEVIQTYRLANVPAALPKKNQPQTSVAATYATPLHK